MIFLKIIWLNHRDIENPRAGGAERTIHEIGRRLAARGHQFRLFTGGWKGAEPLTEIDGIAIRRFGTRILPHLVLPLFLAENRDATIIVDDMAHAMPWFSPWFSRRPGTVFFHHLHARTLRGQISVFLSPLLKELERAYPVIYRNWPFVTESAASETDLRDLGVEPQRITRIPPGVDLARFRMAKKTLRPQLVYFGGLRPYKRPEHALYVMRLLARKGLKQHLVMVGDGPLLPSLRALASKIGLEDDVTFVGKLHPDKLARVVGESWVNIHCSVAEGWCFSATEASAAGTPTVGYAVVGLSEVVRNGKNGILVRDGDLPALAEAVEKVLESPDDWMKRCRACVEEYSWDRTTDLWEAHLEGVSQRT